MNENPKSDETREAIRRNTTIIAIGVVVLVIIEVVRVVFAILHQAVPR